VRRRDRVRPSNGAGARVQCGELPRIDHNDGAFVRHRLRRHVSYPFRPSTSPTHAPVSHVASDERPGATDTSSRRAESYVFRPRSDRVGISRFDREARGVPRVEAAFEVRCVQEAEVLQGVRREARLEAFLADDHQKGVVIGEPWVVC
jgi:hypothetical protein